MRIAIFTDTFLPQVNGVTNTLKRLGDYLEEKEIDYIFITPEQKCNDDLPYNMESFFSAPLLFYQECRFALPNMIKLNKLLDDFKPEVILLMTEFSVGLSGLRYAKKNGIPVFSNYTTHFGTILKAYKLGWFEKTLQKYISWFHQEVDVALTPSSESEKTLIEMGVENTDVFSRGIDFDRFSPTNRSKEWRLKYGIDDKVVLLYVGRVSYEKDLFVLRESMHELNKTMKDRIALVVTGEGPMLPELKKTMPDNVIFTGYKKGSELERIYASADIFSFPSSFETFGNVVLEAFASKTPVVGVREGGVLKLINHGVNGYLANPKDSDDFTKYLSLLINNDVLRYSFGEEGRAFAKTRSWDKVFENLLDSLIKGIDKKVLESKRNREEIA